MTDRVTPESFAGRDVYDPTGARIGTAGALRTGADGGPEWVGVETGLLGLRETLVPRSAVRVDRDRLTVGYDREVVTGAPRCSPDDDRPLPRDEVHRLCEYYRLDPQGRPRGGQAAVGPWQRTGAFTADAPPAGDAAPGTYLGSHADAPTE
jgi:hypothetical protein